MEHLVEWVDLYHLQVVAPQQYLAHQLFTAKFQLIELGRM
jgi:hypothetical protein